MKVLIASGAGGGTAKNRIGKYFHLKEFGESLTKLGMDYKLVVESDFVSGFPSKNPLNWFSKKKFHKLINDYKPDVVLVDRQSHFGLETIKHKIPLFVLLRGHYWLEVQFAKNTIANNMVKKKVLDLRSKIAQKVFNDATAILPICNYLKTIVEEHTENPFLDIFIEGIDDEKWTSTEGMKLKHPCIGLMQDANWWGKTKEMLVLENVVKNMPDVTFYWAGDGQYKEKILDVLQKYENFIWLGSLNYPDQVRDYLSEIDIYAIITGMDTTPLSLKEAQLMKLPVIATDVGGNSETMRDKETGFLVKEGNPKDLEEKISYLLNHKEEAKIMGEKGRKFIREKYSLEASAKQFQKIINKFLKNN